MLLLWAASSNIALAKDQDYRWTLVLSNVVKHYSDDPNHNNQPRFIGLQYRLDGSRWHVGASTFFNSFGQRSFYTWVGRRFDSDRHPLYLKVTGGILQGYRGPYRDKIPFNSNGVAPAIVPAIGIQQGRFASELAVLGDSALMLGFTVDF